MLVVRMQLVGLSIMVDSCYCLCFVVWQIINTFCNWRALNVTFASGFWNFISHRWNKYEHLEAFWFNGNWWILLLSHRGGLQMCLELVVDKITQIPYYCKVGETHLKHSNFLNQDWKDFFIIRILTWLYRCHFQIENLDKLIFVNNNCPLDLCIDCYKHFNCMWNKILFDKRAWT